MVYPLDTKKENKSGISSSYIKHDFCLGQHRKEYNAKAHWAPPVLEQQGPGTSNGDNGGICSFPTMVRRGPSGSIFIIIIFL
jgi:hypothetical protein